MCLRRASRSRTWILPVPPDRHLRARHSCCRRRPAARGDPAERRGRALHGALRPDHQGPRPPGHGEPCDLPGDRRGPRRGRQGFVHLDVRHLPKEVIETSYRTSPSSPGSTSASSPRPSSCRSSRRPLRHGWHPHRREARWSSTRPTRRCRAVRAGECACVSVHGATASGTNSLLDIIVFGRRGASRWRSTPQRPRLAPRPTTVSGGPGPAGRALERSVGGAGDERVAPLRTRLQDE